MNKLKEPFENQKTPVTCYCTLCAKTIILVGYENIAQVFFFDENAFL